MKLYNNNDVRERILQIMKEKNLTIYTIVKTSGLPRTTVRDVINDPNHDPKISTLLKVINAIGEDPASFFKALDSNNS
jgi:predicted transcriptional regulator